MAESLIRGSGLVAQHCGTHPMWKNRFRSEALTLVQKSQSSFHEQDKKVHQLLEDQEHLKAQITVAVEAGVLYLLSCLTLKSWEWKVKLQTKEREKKRVTHQARF